MSRELPKKRSVYWLRTRVELPAELQGKALTFAFPLRIITAP